MKIGPFPSKALITSTLNRLFASLSFRVYVMVVVSSSSSVSELPEPDPVLVVLSIAKPESFTVRPDAIIKSLSSCTS